MSWFAETTKQKIKGSTSHPQAGSRRIADMMRSLLTLVLLPLALGFSVSSTSAMALSSPQFTTGSVQSRHAQQAAARSTPVVMKKKEKEEFKPPPVFSAVNAGPIAILVVIFTFQLLALQPRDSLPPIVQDLIPIVLGKQFAVTPSQ